MFGKPTVCLLRQSLMKSGIEKLIFDTSNLVRKQLFKKLYLVDITNNISKHSSRLPIHLMDDMNDES